MAPSRFSHRRRNTPLEQWPVPLSEARCWSTVDRAVNSLPSKVEKHSCQSVR